VQVGPSAGSAHWLPTRTSHCHASLSHLHFRAHFTSYTSTAQSAGQRCPLVCSSLSLLSYLSHLHLPWPPLLCPSRPVGLEGRPEQRSALTNIVMQCRDELRQPSTTRFCTLSKIASIDNLQDVKCLPPSGGCCPLHLETRSDVPPFALHSILATVIVNLADNSGTAAVVLSRRYRCYGICSALDPDFCKPCECTSPSVCRTIEFETELCLCYLARPFLDPTYTQARKQTQAYRI
jgi:hypothetical protein